jgi:uracil-DNA glycosylase
VAAGVPNARVMPTFHPAYLLRKPEDKGLALRDLRELKAAMGAVGGG